MERSLLKYPELWTVALILIAQQFLLTGATIGVSYGLNGDNLPSPSDVIRLYNNEMISYMRLYDPSHDILAALQGSGIKVAVGTRNEDLPALANDPVAASQWVQANIIPFNNIDFGWIVVGNEVVPGDFAVHVPNAMNNLLTALNSAGLNGIKVSTAVHGVVLGASFPPSAGAFNPQSFDVMNAIVTFLSNTNNPLFVNVHPYWSLASDPAHISLDYALFRPGQPFMDGDLAYNSLFEATIDAFYSAMEKCNAGNVGLVVGETGWPTAGNDPFTSVANARDYNQNLINLVKVKGTPKRPTTILDTFIFAMFDEDLKPVGVEQHWGLHHPDMTPVYPLTF